MSSKQSGVLFTYLVTTLFTEHRVQPLVVNTERSRLVRGTMSSKPPGDEVGKQYTRLFTHARTP